MSILAAVAAVLVHGAVTGRPADASPVKTSNRLAVATLGVAWIAMGALPLLGQFYVSPTLEGSRYLYLPAVGLSLLLSASVAESSRCRRLSALALTVVLIVYAMALYEERAVWQEAATMRDEVLAQAEAKTRSQRCRTLQIIDAPDNVRGAFVFREGLSEAMATMPYDADGVECVFRWDGATLVSHTLPDVRGDGTER